MAQVCNCQGYGGTVQIRFGSTQCCDPDGNLYTTGAQSGYENVLCSGCADCCGKAGMGEALVGGGGQPVRETEGASSQPLLAPNTTLLESNIGSQMGGGSIGGQPYIPPETPMGGVVYSNFTMPVFKKPLVPVLVMGMVIGVGLWASYQLTKTLKV